MGKTLRLALLLGGLWLSGAVQSLELKECRIQDTSGVSSVAAECGYFRVPEDPDAPDGKQIQLFVARIPVLGKQRTEEAFTLLAGGPGQAATEAYVNLQGAFERIRRSHDILLVDQRGTGRSNRLSCKLPAETALLSWHDEETIKVLKRCRDSLPGDPRFYTTSVAVRDLDAVRQALGYSQLVLYGGSYGTAVAQHYLRRFPERTRSVILDGVLPPDIALATQTALSAQRSLDMTFGRCRSEPECHARFPELEQAFRRVQQRLRAQPVELEIRDPETAQPQTTTLSYELMVAGIRLLSYRPETAALLPLMITEADRGNYAPMAAQSLLSVASMEDALALGMHNAVVCAEDLPFIDARTVDLQALEASYMGSEQYEGLKQICNIWPRGVTDPDFKQPLVADTPVLLLSGEIDPVTPPAYAEQVAASLSSSRHLVGAGQGHGMISVGCVARLVADFVRDGSLEQLDADCIGRLGPTPAFIDFNGPTP